MMNFINWSNDVIATIFGIVLVVAIVAGIFYKIVKD